MSILSLDQAFQCTGYAVFENEELVRHGTFTITPKENDVGRRLIEFVNQVSMLLDDNGIDTVIFEGIQYQNNIETYKKLAYVQAALIILCTERGLPYEILAPSRWRSILGGSWGKKRDEQKKHSIEHVLERYGAEAATSDEADAICIGEAYIMSDKSMF